MGKKEKNKSTTWHVDWLSNNLNQQEEAIRSIGLLLEEGAAFLQIDNTDSVPPLAPPRSTSRQGAELVVPRVGCTSALTTLFQLDNPNQQKDKIHLFISKIKKQLPLIIEFFSMLVGALTGLTVSVLTSNFVVFLPVFAVVQKGLNIIFRYKLLNNNKNAAVSDELKKLNDQIEIAKLKLMLAKLNTNIKSLEENASVSSQIDNTDSVPPLVPPRSTSKLAAALQVDSSDKLANNKEELKSSQSQLTELESVFENIQSNIKSIQENVSVSSQIDNTDSIPPVVPPRSRSQTAPLQAVSSKKMARPLVPPKPKSWDEKNVNNINNLSVNNFELDQKSKSLHRNMGI